MAFLAGSSYTSSRLLQHWSVRTKGDGLVTLRAAFTDDAEGKFFETTKDRVAAVFLALIDARLNSEVARRVDKLARHVAASKSMTGKRLGVHQRLTHADIASLTAFIEKARREVGDVLQQLHCGPDCRAAFEWLFDPRLVQRLSALARAGGAFAPQSRKERQSHRSDSEPDHSSGKRTLAPVQRSSEDASRWYGTLYSKALRVPTSD